MIFWTTGEGVWLSPFLPLPKAPSSYLPTGRRPPLHRGAGFEMERSTRCTASLPTPIRHANFESRWNDPRSTPLRPSQLASRCRQFLPDFREIRFEKPHKFRGFVHLLDLLYVRLPYPRIRHQYVKLRDVRI